MFFGEGRLGGVGDPLVVVLGGLVLAGGSRSSRLRGCARGPGRSKRRPWPGWAEEKPNRIWIYDTTHWSGSESATTVITDVISRKWVGDVTSTEETSIQVQAAFIGALRDEGLAEVIEGRFPTTPPATASRCCW